MKCHGKTDAYVEISTTRTQRQERVVTGDVERVNDVVG